MVFSEKCAMDVKWNSGTLHITRKVDAALFSTLSSAMGGWWQGVARGALPLLAGGAYPGENPTYFYPAFSNLTI